MGRAIEIDQRLFYAMNDTMQIGEWKEVMWKKTF